MNKINYILPIFMIFNVHAEDIFAGSGIILSESGFANAQENKNIGTEIDCYGPALGVTTSGAGGTEDFIFGADGKPCAQAETLFNGDNPADRRAPPPSIHIGFADELGTQPRTLNTQIPSINPTDFAECDPITDDSYEFHRCPEPSDMWDYDNIMGKSLPCQGTQHKKKKSKSQKKKVRKAKKKAQRKNSPLVTCLKNFGWGQIQKIYVYSK